MLVKSKSRNDHPGTSSRLLATCCEERKNPGLKDEVESPSAEKGSQGGTVARSAAKGTYTKGTFIK